MATNDAGTQDGPTCPLSDDGLFDAITESGMFPSHRRREQGKALALAVVAAERARLREAFIAQLGMYDLGPCALSALACFNRAVAEVDADARRVR